MAPILLHVFSSLAVGGQQTRFVTIANRLGPAFRHRLVSLDSNTAAVAQLDPTIDHAVLAAPSVRGNLLARLRHIAVFGRTIAADALVTYNWGAIEWALANRLLLHHPHIHLEDGFGPEEADRQLARRVLLRRLVLHRSTLVVPSRKLAEIARTVWRLDPNSIVYVPNGIDAARFDGVAHDGEPFFSRRDDECVVGSFSPLRPEKNIGRLLRAFAAIPAARRSAVRLVICGDGPERAGLDELTRSFGIAERVIFAGHVPRPEAVMGAFDVFAITSDTEQMPYAVVEAMAARLPVLSTDVGDIAMMVAGINRPFVVPRDDAAALAAALAQLGDEPALRRRIGDANRGKVEADFTIPRMVDPFHRVLLDAVGHPVAVSPVRPEAAGC
jgi:L-malate glycosyltransferase